MDKQEILEYNKRCAEFLGGKYIRDERLSFEPKGRWYIPQFPDAQQNYDLKFHSDWNWIMEVVEKILNICLALDSMEMYCNIADAIPDKEAVVQAINEFLIWHGTQSSM